MIDIAMLLVPKEVPAAAVTINSHLVCLLFHSYCCLCLLHSLPTPQTVWGLLPVQFDGSTESQGNLFRRLHLELFLNPPIFSDFAATLRGWEFGTKCRSAAEELMCQAHDKVIVDANGDILTKEQSGSLASTKTGDELPHVQQTKLVNIISLWFMI